MSDAEKYWTVEFSAFAFDSKESACAFREALEDIFMEMELAEGIAASTQVIEATE